MLVFAISDKGGTGRSVTSGNVAYRRALQGADVCYVDFDFGSPTAGALFHLENMLHGVRGKGMHSFLQGTVGQPYGVDVWAESESDALRLQPPGAGRLVLYPGDQGGAEFSFSDALVERCARLFVELDEQYERWLVFHKWTRQHIISAADLVSGDRGILRVGEKFGHSRAELARSLRFVRTAVLAPDSPDLAGLRAAQVAWLQDAHSELQRLASKQGIGRTNMLGIVPHDPVLQWREQLISDDDVALTAVANQATVDAFNALALRLVDDDVWRGL